MTTNVLLQRRRENAADRLRAALAPDSEHRFGTWKTRGTLTPTPGDRKPLDNPEAEAEARLRAERCLRNLEAKNVRAA